MHRPLSKRLKIALLILFLFITLIAPLFGITGLVLTWFWNKWSKRVKIIVALIPFMLYLIPFLFLLIYSLFFTPFQIKGDAMYPNLKNDEYLMVNKFSLRSRQIKRGDIITFKAPPDQTKVFINRVIAIPSDTIKVQNGNVYLNGKLLDESLYLKSSIKTSGGTFLKEGESTKIPMDQYFVMGDNRNYSSDSREWGFVKKNLIIGFASFCYWNCK